MGNRPDWANSPRWARWVAMDGDGFWRWHEAEPIPGRFSWTHKAIDDYLFNNSNGVHHIDFTPETLHNLGLPREESCHCYSRDNLESWKATLERRPSDRRVIEVGR